MFLATSVLRAGTYQTILPGFKVFTTSAREVSSTAQKSKYTHKFKIAYDLFIFIGAGVV